MLKFTVHALKLTVCKVVLLDKNNLLNIAYSINQTTN